MKKFVTDPQVINDVLTRGVTEVLPSAEGLAELLSKKKIRLYLGIDPTGSFLTLGHAVVLRKLQQFADLGHEVILLIGNGTVRIGDPTGRDGTRPVLTDDQIRENFKNWKAQASKILNFDQIIIKHNGDWLDKLSFADIVKLMAQTTVQQLIERDMFQERIKKKLPIFGHEVMYPMLQGFDSVAMNVDLEIGGNDQTFNMLMGRHLQKIYNKHEKWVLTTPILKGTDGRKMSKSFNNFIALTDNPNNMFGKLMSLHDDLIIDYFTLLTCMPLVEIEEMSQKIQSGENPMQFKKRLAFVITEIFHMTDAAQKAETVFEQTIQSKVVPNDAPVIRVSTTSLSILDLLALCLPEESRGRLKKLITQGGVELMPSGERPTDVNAIIHTSSVEVVRVGKLRHFQIVKSGR